MIESMQAAGVESREIEMEKDDSADYQQAADDQQAEAPNFPQVKIKEDEETQYPQLSKHLAFKRKRGNSYINCVSCACPARQNFLLIQIHLQICAIMGWEGQYLSLSIGSSDSDFVVLLALLH